MEVIPECEYLLLIIVYLVIPLIDTKKIVLNIRCYT